MPSKKTVMLRISVSMKSMRWYTVLPTVCEYMVENGYPKCILNLAEVGLLAYFLCLHISSVLYFLQASPFSTSHPQQKAQSCAGNLFSSNSLFEISQQQGWPCNA